MQLQRRGPVGSEVPVVVEQERTFDLRGLTADIDGAFLAADGIGRVRAALAAGELPEIDLTDQRIGAPIAKPTAVVCIGQNYAAHAAESGDAPPENPIIFFKHPNTVVGPDDDVRLPPESVKADWEVELAVVIGKTARYLPDKQAAADCIAGYTVSNDVSERYYQAGVSGGQWSKGKCCETFNPLGPSLVPADEVDVQNLSLGSWVNGEPRQDSNTSDMIFDVAQLVYELSQFLVLDPGDVINTGTPQGVALSGRFPFLKVGDEMRIAIEGLGEQRQRVVAAPDLPAGAGAAAIRR
ncbi:fumarylacetoacetate hydrolase family protein [Microlunatus panaciterrae]|uniref:2-keto-4-pentenoate hydratase/2-oxohepta-3-ene-1,7-dioic acid hydratase in catechol pathway n=1 Tax=Microlunatus panaciterrae TaxID=400768 RepID=A0ABS2RFM2_9ACTN|nr:fumarylacetoacetate hydrolase family protein [Microlunatus panaciterrae]MBM7797543.1 2-keto-4-pentenoate hydratase/2-oxohepta-3-ene-1,7-dioic acid hydratase in catechol pathway [Microlunatus panaciterrae]